VTEQLKIIPAAAAFIIVVLTMTGPSCRVKAQGGPYHSQRGPITLSLISLLHPSPSTVAEVLSECRLLAYISQVPTQMSFLFRLINIIHVQTLTQVRWPS
jgi:hypothetical protein